MTFQDFEKMFSGFKGELADFNYAMKKS